MSKSQDCVRQNQYCKELETKHQTALYAQSGAMSNESCARQYAMGAKGGAANGGHGPVKAGKRCRHRPFKQARGL
jgi:hypothetical protein